MNSHHVVGQVIAKVILLGAIVAFGGCSFEQLEPESAIVKKVEAAGSGDLKGLSAQSMQQWLGKHRELAIEVETLCKPVRQGSPAKWAESTEGRLCTASAALAAWRFTPQQGDGKTYKGGLR
jgi:hypothetical protein